MRIGFFGGTFDPPHLGHLAVARAAARAFSLDRVLFVPTALQPLKPGGAIASYADRLNMISLLCGWQPMDAHFVASNLDAPRSDAEPNYTVDTITKLRTALEPKDNLYIIIGADAFGGVPGWHLADKLLNMADWIVVSRPGFVIGNLELLPVPSSCHAHIHLLNGVVAPISATNIREQLRRGSACEDLLPPSVLTYIYEHSLYGRIPR